MCNYCNNEHGMIGDVVCPVLKRFPESYASKPVFTDSWPNHFDVSWPVLNFNLPKTHRPPKSEPTGLFTAEEKKEFQGYVGDISSKSGFVKNKFLLTQNVKYNGFFKDNEKY